MGRRRRCVLVLLLARAAQEVAAVARAGVLVWVQHASFPWWPGMLTYDPHSGEFTRESANHRAYHIQDGGLDPTLLKVGRLSPKLANERAAALQQAHAVAELSLRERILRWACDFKTERGDKAKPKLEESDKDQATAPGTVSAPPRKIGVPRSKTAYQFYLDHRRADVMHNLDDDGTSKFARNGKVTKLIAAEWQTLTADERLPFDKQAEKAKKQAISKAQEMRAELEKSEPVTPERTASLKPAVPRTKTAYMFYLDHRRADVMKGMDDDGTSKFARNGRVTKLIAAEWKALSEEARAPFVEAAEIAKKTAIARTLELAQADASCPDSPGDRPPPMVAAFRLFAQDFLAKAQDSGDELVHLDSADQGLRVHEKWMALTRTQQRAFVRRVQPDALPNKSGASTAAASPSASVSPDEDQASNEGQPAAKRSRSSRTTMTANDDTCRICGELGQLICCDGGCRGAFHLECLSILQPPTGEFRCDECSTGNHTCYTCDKVGADLIKCQFPHCNKLYHRGCAEKQFKADNFCLVCGTGGDLVVCDGCPGAYHAACIKSTFAFTGKPDEQGQWFCHDCLTGTKSMIHDVVWAKYGSYRWWPAVILSATEYPERCGQSPAEGNFLVKFLGSNDVAWVGHESIIPFSNGDQKNSYFTRNLKAAKKSFQEAVTLALDLFTERKQEREDQLAAIRGKIIERPPRFKLIKRNVYLPPAAKPPHRKEEQEICRCDAALNCADMHSCLNRMMYIECDAKCCNNGKNCRNQRFQRREYPKLIPFKTEHRGWGLRLGQDVEEGDLVIEYVGEVIDGAECRRRIDQYEERNTSSFYILSLGSDTFVDAREKANMARFINHSCDPNCVTQKWNVLGETRVGIFAKRALAKGTELTFDYMLDCLNSVKKTPCHCGAPNCSGFIGVKPNRSGTTYEDLDRTDDECFICKDGGDLLMCDKKNCDKVYHLACLGMNKVPAGKFICPHHACLKCGRKATIFSETGPEAYCSMKHIATPEVRALCEGKRPPVTFKSPVPVLPAVFANGTWAKRAKRAKADPTSTTQAQAASA
ncbi:uncharacterized protein MONBRDRAFT_33094 [Monosiga brevicollis MX1]|uniref:Histone-lysine N-methyltransferase n=1 Tax=Monosiga brevicollis TaxID=81824 RepID=A9V3N8_MONBE|nr:uncharacterized protein MONBRDRAFT_33094 [Monosiga brevicollis MX1]EDQ87845.1 predicted protein [Monosiga brevicollis MX1]|eukprot:XP_001747378.1 hypothetical protein [Monosiga brevicollis MX1]